MKYTCGKDLVEIVRRFEKNRKINGDIGEDLGKCKRKRVNEKTM